MTNWTLYLSPVLSAILGAIAIRVVEILSTRRSAVSAVHHELAENYWRIEGEIRDVQRGNWSDEYTRAIRLDAIEAVKAHSPQTYTRLVNEVNNFPSAVSSLEYLQRTQIESRKPDAHVTYSEDEVLSKLREVQDLLAKAEENLEDYISENPIRWLLISTAINEVDFDDPRKVGTKETIRIEGR